MTNIRLGIIGLGAQGNTYADFINENKVKNVVIGAICDIDPDKKALATENTQIRLFIMIISIY